MNKKDMLYSFIKRIQRKKLLTLFLKDILDYEELHDYNYLFRITKNKYEVIMDIYDNISANRFNRYVFCFNDIIDKNIKYENAFLTYIDVYKDSSIKINKLGHLFNLDNDKMISYAYTFLDSMFVDILKEMLKK